MVGILPTFARRFGGRVGHRGRLPYSRWSGASSKVGPSACTSGNGGSEEDEHATVASRSAKATTIFMNFLWLAATKGGTCGSDAAGNRDRCRCRRAYRCTSSPCGRLLGCSSSKHLSDAVGCSKAARHV